MMRPDSPRGYKIGELVGRNCIATPSLGANDALAAWTTDSPALTTFPLAPDAEQM
jgi:hypothetical protein